MQEEHECTRREKAKETRITKLILPSFFDESETEGTGEGEGF